MYKRWKQGQATKEELRNVAWASVLRKVKAQLKLRFSRDVKDNKRTFYCYISNKRLTKENVGPMLSGLGDIVTTETDKSEVLKAFFVSVCTNDVSHTSVISEHVQEEQPAVDRD